MARQPRIEFEGAFYHVIVRGNQRQDIFGDEEDRLAYLERVERYKEKCGFVLYAYVLMSNHVHLLIETPKMPISKIMQLINLTYTQHFNKKYGKVGHLFQGRYKSFLCDRDAYLVGLVRYIHLNPVRAGVVARPEEYRWSSHGDYLSDGTKSVDTERVLSLFSERISEARKLYRKFVNEGIGAGSDESYYKTVAQQIVGDDKFIEKIGARIDRAERPLRKPSLQEIAKAVEKVTGVTWEEITSRSRAVAAVYARGVMVGVWRELGHRMVDLQPKLRRDLSVLSRLSRLTESQDGRKTMRRILRELNAFTQA